MPHYQYDYYRKTVKDQSIQAFRSWDIRQNLNPQTQYHSILKLTLDLIGSLGEVKVSSQSRKSEFRVFSIVHV